MNNAPVSTRPTKKQKELLQFIQNFINGHGYGPSYREIMRGLNYKSVSTVATHVDNLISRGHLIKRERSARSLEVVNSTEDTLSNASQVTKEQSKWLIDLVTSKFDLLGDNITQKDLDELYVLTGSLKILGLTEAAEFFKSKLQDLN